MVESTVNKILYKIGTSPVFAFPVRFISPDDVACYINVNGTERKLDSAEYSVERKEDYSDGANVTLNLNPLPAGATLAIVRECAIVQTVAFPISGKFPASSNEEALDRLTLICQELAENSSRAISVPVTDTQLNPNDLLDQISQAATDSQEAKKLVEQFLNTFSKLTVGSDGKLYWDGCEIVTKCNLKSVLNELGIEFEGGDGDNGSGDGDAGGDNGSGGNGGGSVGTDEGLGNGGGEVTGDPEIGDDKGVVRVHTFRRKASYRLFGLSNQYLDTKCEATSYVTGVVFNWEQPASFTRYYGELITVQGEYDIGYDDEGEEFRECLVEPDVFCSGSDNCFATYDSNGDLKTFPRSLSKSAADAGSADIRRFLYGDLHNLAESERPTDFPIAASGWTGFQNFRRNNDGQSIIYEDDIVSIQTISRASYYDAWGGHPCENGDGDFSIDLSTKVFEWVPHDEYDGPAPRGLVLEMEDGSRRQFSFGVEYCIQGMADMKLDWADLIVCPAIYEHCPWIVTSGTVNGDGSSDEYVKPESDIIHELTYKGVVF